MCGTVCTTSAIALCAEREEITLRVFVIGSVATTVEEDELGGKKSADRGEWEQTERADVSHTFTSLTASVCADNLLAGIT